MVEQVWLGDNEGISRVGCRCACVGDGEAYD